jgi:hypothetical protein
MCLLKGVNNAKKNDVQIVLLTELNYMAKLPRISNGFIV